MSGLEQVKTAIAGALEQAGLPAMAAFPPDWVRQCAGPVAAVGLRTGESRGGAIGSYLGQQVDPATLACRELYGMRLELTVSLDIYCPPEMGAAGCDGALEKLHQAMLEGLPAGLRPTELKWEEIRWDEDTALLLRKGSLSCSAFFTASASGEDSPALSDFILKGVVSN